MNEYKFFQIDAFAEKAMGGGPAAVMPMEIFPAAEVMQAIAAENNLAETAFLVRRNGDYDLRWFTPVLEVPLCGHATLASAAVVMEQLEPGRDRVVFHSVSGPLAVRRNGRAYVMDFPARPSEGIETPPGLADALGAQPLEVTSNQHNFMAILDDERTVRELAPNMDAIARIGRPGVIVTAKSDGEYDFVSRYFAPAKGVPEDPVTGAAHCMLAPYWSKRLHKTEFRAFQASKRGGEVRCRLLGERVELEGECVFYLKGEIEI